MDKEGLKKHLRELKKKCEEKMLECENENEQYFWKGRAESYFLLLLNLK